MEKKYLSQILTEAAKFTVAYLRPSLSALSLSPTGRRSTASLFSLTAKLEVSCPADDGAAAVDGQTLIGAGVSHRLRVADHQAARHQAVTQVQTQRHLCAIHKPPARQKAGNRK